MPKIIPIGLLYHSNFLYLMCAYFLESDQLKGIEFYLLVVNILKSFNDLFKFKNQIEIV